VELRHLRYFIAVAEQLNFSRAAKQLHIAQPPLSRQIRQLEERIGVQLLVRTKRQVELTNAGRVFLEEARKLILQAEHAAEVARRAQKGESGTIKLGIASGLGGVVARVVAEHCQRFPEIDIECRDIFSTIQNEALRKREIDVGFLRPPIDQINLNFEMLFEERFAVVLPKTHPMAKRRALRLKDIADEPLIIFNRNISSGLYERILDLYRKRGFTPHLTVTHAEAHEEAGTIMIASGKGIYIGVGAIVTRSVSGVEVATVRLNEPDAKIEVYVGWRKDEKSAAVAAFLDSVRRVFELSRNQLSLASA
jgi:DNA-binding transcriptional LysR family regulator